MPMLLEDLAEETSASNRRAAERLLAEGRVVNLIAAEGSPSAVMDLSFAAQALALAWLAGGETGLTAGVHPMPASIDVSVAEFALAAQGTRIDTLTREQQEYLASWRQGS